MIQQMRVVGEHIDPSDQLKAYVSEKIGRLDKYLPRRARRTVRAEIMLREEQARSTGDDTAEVLLYVPGTCLKAHASADTMETAVDLAEGKLRQQIETYRNEHSPKFYQHLMRRFQKRIV